MGLFSKPILTGKRRKSLDSFRQHAVKALKDLAKNAPDSLSREIFEGMIYSVESTPIYFYPRKVLKATFLPGTSIPISATMGENVNQIQIIQQGSHQYLIRTNFINLPAEHVFEGEKLSMNGIFTLSHEYAHFPKPSISEFASKHGILHETAEELIADILSAKLAVKLGYPKEHVLKHFSGREIVYGMFPFRKFIENAVK